MINIEIEIANKKLKFSHPEKYNELNKHQFLKIVELFVLDPVPLAHRTDAQIRLLEHLLRDSDSKAERKKVFRIIDSLVADNMLNELLDLQKFIYENQDFNNWIIKDLKVNNQLFLGPLDRFSYMKFGEFIVADMLFMNYFKTEDVKILNKLIAVLYRPYDKNNEEKADKRTDFNTDTIEKRELSIASISEIEKHAILFNYSGVRYWLTTKYPFVFSDNNKKNTQVIQLGNNKSGWMTIRRHLAGSVFNLEKTDNLLLSDVLEELNEELSK